MYPRVVCALLLALHFSENVLSKLNDELVPKIYDGKPSGAERPIVHLKNQGLIRGRKALDGEYYEYLGVPYAEVSMDNRFKGVLPIPTWDGVREATVENIECQQYDFKTSSVIGVEDCLVINVYTPRIYSSTILPVMVYIHGGGFAYGSSIKSIYGPGNFMNENVVLVTFNYRLGLHGFLCVGDVANAGIKDAVAVLEWVQANIATFGGDKDRVTIFGQSAGAILVDILMLTEKTNGLIHNAISQSGSVLSNVAILSNNHDDAYKLASVLGHNPKNDSDLINFLRKERPDHLVKTFYLNSLPSMSPCVEPSSNTDAILTKKPLDIIRSGKFKDIPYIAGVVEDEGLLVHEMLQQGAPIINIIAQHVVSTLPTNLMTENSYAEKEMVGEKVNEFYFSDQSVTLDSMNEVVKYLSDTFFLIPMIVSVRNIVSLPRISPVYFYRFTYDGGLAFEKSKLGIMDKPGVCHADELGYQFTMHGLVTQDKDDASVVKNMAMLWTDFAKFRNPTPANSRADVRWEPVQREAFNYLRIDSTLTTARDPFHDRVEFWNQFLIRVSGPGPAELNMIDSHGAAKVSLV